MYILNLYVNIIEIIEISIIIISSNHKLFQSSDTHLPQCTMCRLPTVIRGILGRNRISYIWFTKSNDK